MFDSFASASSHAEQARERLRHDADATEKFARPSGMSSPALHGRAGPLPAPLARCGACGTTTEVNTRWDLAQFEDQHEQSCGEDAVIEFQGALTDLPD